MSLVLALCTFGVTETIELRFQHMRRAVLAADPQQLEKLGAHVVVGYRKPSELHTLLERRAIAGVFLSALNVERETRRMRIRDTIDSLQDIRRAQNLAPLWIATDQEGGPVSRMSPPLARMPPLAEIVAFHRDPAERRLVRQYAARQGRELRSLGVNLNFAPVVDLNHGIHNPEDRLTRIAARAIAGPGGRHRGRGALLRHAAHDRRALHAEAFSGSRACLRGHPQVLRRPWSAGAWKPEATDIGFRFGI